MVERIIIRLNIIFIFPITHSITQNKFINMLLLISHNY